MKNAKYLIPVLTILLFFFLLLIPSANATHEKGAIEPQDGALSPPTFTLSPMSFTYDGFVHLLKVENLTHERADEGFYTFSWYKDGRLLESSASSLPIQNVRDSGSYMVSVTFTLGGESVLVYSSSVSVLVSPTEIVRPEPFPISGPNRTPLVEPSKEIKIDGNP